MHSGSLRQVDHTEAHEEPVKIYGGGREGELGELQHDAHLGDEVDPFTATRILGFQLHAVELRGGPRELLVGE